MNRTEFKAFHRQARQHRNTVGAIPAPFWATKDGNRITYTNSILRRGAKHSFLLQCAAEARRDLVGTKPGLGRRWSLHDHAHYLNRAKEVRTGVWP